MTEEQTPYLLEYSDAAIESLRTLDRAVARRIIAKLRWLADNAETLPHFALAGRWRGLYRLRVGDYRAIYKLNHELQLLLVEIVGHRREIYEE